MRKQRKRTVILFCRNWISLILVLTIFYGTIYAQDSGSNTSQEAATENTVESEPIQNLDTNETTENKEAVNEEKVEENVADPNTLQSNPADSSESGIVPPFAIKGNPLPDETTQASLEAILSAPYMPIDIMVGQQYLLNDADAFSFHGFVYVPLRSVVNLVQGASLTWNQENLRADVVLPIDGVIRNLSFFSNSTIYLDNGIITPLPAATLQKGNTMIIPLSFWTELLGISAEYDSLYHVITLDPKNIAINPAALGNRFYGPAEVKDLSRLIYKEAGGASYDAMHAVASVILNHVRHPLYPNTLSGVIFAVAPSGVPHYTPAHKSGFGSVIPNYHSILAAKKVLRGENSVGQAIFFNTRPFKNRKILTKINGIYFCY